jgi:hypothetical protein
VNDIREVDLSPFYVAEVQLADYVLRLREPLVLTPELDESKQLMCLVYPRSASTCVRSLATSSTRRS